MSARMVIELADGRKVLFGGQGHAGGLAEVGLGANMTKATAGQLQSALGSLAGVVEGMEQAIGRLVRRPDKMELELRASLTADCDLWIVSGEGEAEFKVTLSWGRDPS